MAARSGDPKNPVALRDKTTVPTRTKSAVQAAVPGTARAVAPRPSTRSGEDTAKAVAELRAFVAALERRPDIEVTEASIGRGASAKEIAKRDLPRELAELYAAMDGAHVEWSFVAPPLGGGCMRIPALGEWDGFRDDDAHGMGFGRAQEAALLDEVQAEDGTWFVRTKGTLETRLIFASSSEGRGGVVPADTIAGYLRAAIHHGLVNRWPFVPTRKRNNASYAKERAAIARFRAPPQARKSIEVGQRVTYESTSERGRAEVIAFRSPAGSIARLRLDDGCEAWIERRHIAAVAREDAYERLRGGGLASGVSTAGQIRDRMDDVVRAIGPQRSFWFCEIAGTVPNTARRAAGLQGDRSLAEAVGELVALFEATQRAKIDFSRRRMVRTNEDTFSRADVSKVTTAYGLREAFDGLLGGLVILTHQESSTTKRAGRSLVPKVLVARLARMGPALNAGAARCMLGPVLERLESPKVLQSAFDAVTPETVDDLRRLLPKGAGIGVPSLR